MSAPQDDQLLLEQEILRDHRAYTTGATEPRGHDGQVQQRGQEIPHVRVSVGQTSGAAQRCRILDSAPELAIRDPQAARRIGPALAFEHTGKTHVPGQSELPMDSRGRRRRELARKCRVSVETARPNVAITSDTPATASLYSYEKCSSLVPDSSPDAHRA